MLLLLMVLLCRGDRCACGPGPAASLCRPPPPPSTPQAYPNATVAQVKSILDKATSPIVFSSTSPARLVQAQKARIAPNWNPTPATPQPQPNATNPAPPAAATSPAPPSQPKNGSAAIVAPTLSKLTPGYS